MKLGLTCAICEKQFDQRDDIHTSSEGEDVCVDCCDVCKAVDREHAVCRYGGYTWTITEERELKL